MLYLIKVITGEQAFRIREPELRVREQENKPGTGELIITCDNALLVECVPGVYQTSRCYS